MSGSAAAVSVVRPCQDESLGGVGAVWTPSPRSLEDRFRFGLSKQPVARKTRFRLYRIENRMLRGSRSQRV